MARRVDERIAIMEGEDQGAPARAGRRLAHKLRKQLRVITLDEGVCKIRAGKFSARRRQRRTSCRVRPEVGRAAQKARTPLTIDHDPTEITMIPHCRRANDLSAAFQHEEIG